MQKKQLYEECQRLIQQRIDVIDAAMREAQGSANEETKSSAGDKYETGRAMMHLETEKLTSQRVEILKLKRVLDQIDPLRPASDVSLGSLVHTEQGLFYLAVGLGTVAVEEQFCTVISPMAPLGQALRGHRIGDQVTFNGRSFSIHNIQ